MQGLPIVTIEEMKRIESLAIADGCSEEGFMDEAGAKIAAIAMDFIHKYKLPGKVTLLIGKGNKGGDAFRTGICLLKKNIAVTAFHFFNFDACSPLCRIQGQRFLSMKGEVIFTKSVHPLIFERNSLLIDGLLGTGFQGTLEGTLLQVVQKMNTSHLPILAIDIPSGLNGSTGEVMTSSVKATQTVYLGLPKLGFFIQQGYCHVGELIYADFGLPQAYLGHAKAMGYLVDETKMRDLLPPVVRNRHKYQAGYVVGIAGSKGMSGAAKLSSMASFRAGAGIVRLFYSADMAEEMENTPIELLSQPWFLKDISLVLEAMAKANAIFIGPGMGRDKEAEKFLLQLLPKIKKPIVLDADALFILAQQQEVGLPEQCVVTPHRQEMLRLLGKKDISKHEWQFLEQCQGYVEKKNITLVLKGAPTFIFHPQERPIVIPKGDPGMAKAGVGDVLTGVIAALMAQGMVPYRAAVLGVYLHALAGEIAVKKKTSYGIIASDLVDCLPNAFKQILN